MIWASGSLYQGCLPSKSDLVLTAGMKRPVGRKLGLRDLDVDAHIREIGLYKGGYSAPQSDPLKAVELQVPVGAGLTPASPSNALAVSGSYPGAISANFRIEGPAV